MLTDEQKLEIGRMLQEGVSVEGIRAVVASWPAMWIEPEVSYAAFVEYGLPPLDESKTVEGTIEQKENGGV